MAVTSNPVFTVPVAVGAFIPLGDESTKIAGMPIGGFAIGLASAVIGIAAFVVPLGICYHKIRAKRNRPQDVELNDMPNGLPLDEGNPRPGNALGEGSPGPGNALVRFLGRLRG